MRAILRGGSFRFYRARKREEVLRPLAKENEKARKGNQLGASSAKLPNLTPIDTRKEAAKTAGVGERTYDAGKPLVAKLGELCPAKPPRVAGAMKGKKGGNAELLPFPKPIIAAYRKLDEACKRFGIEYQTARKSIQVCRSFESGRRRPLSFEHHKEVAGREDKVELLEWAVESFLACKSDGVR